VSRSAARPRRTKRRAVVTLVMGPVLCGLVVAALATGAWLALGSPSASAAVWFQVTKLGGARYTAAPEQPFFALILGTGARSDDPSQSSDDPGLADAVHVIGVNPALNAWTMAHTAEEIVAACVDARVPAVKKNGSFATGATT